MGIKVLVVEDNEQDRKIIKRFLNKAGYDNVVMAVTGQEGIDEAKKEEPELIILDTILPDMPGFEVCRRIRQIDELKYVKIVIQTGSIDAVDAVKAKQVGADDYCVKTSDCAPLLLAVKNMAEGKNV